MTYPRLIDDGSVWIVVIPPVIWAAHFLTCYWVAAVWCASGAAPLTPVVWAIAAITVAALGGIGWAAVVAVRRYGGLRRPGHHVSRDEPEGRKAFLGHVALLLASLNGVAVLFTALPVLVFRQC